jgi:hypothetical protein
LVEPVMPQRAPSITPPAERDVATEPTSRDETTPSPAPEQDRARRIEPQRGRPRRATLRRMSPAAHEQTWQMMGDEDWLTRPRAKRLSGPASGLRHRGR